MSEAPRISRQNPGQLIAVIIASFAIPIILIVLFANYANHAFRAAPARTRYPTNRSPHVSPRSPRST